MQGGQKVRKNVENNKNQKINKIESVLHSLLAWLFHGMFLRQEKITQRQPIDGADTSHKKMYIKGIECI